MLVARHEAVSRFRYHYNLQILRYQVKTGKNFNKNNISSTSWLSRKISCLFHVVVFKSQGICILASATVRGRKSACVPYPSSAITESRADLARTLRLYQSVSISILESNHRL